MFSKMEIGSFVSLKFTYGARHLAPQAEFHKLKDAVTFQGLTSFGDTAMHRSMSKSTFGRLHSRGDIGGSFVILVFMDDAAQGIEPSLQTGATAATVKNMLRNSANEFEIAFDIKTNAPKSLKGVQKFILLNEVYFGNWVLPSFMKFFGKCIFCPRDFLETYASYSEKIISFTFDLKDAGVPKWMSLVFGLYMYFAHKWNEATQVLGQKDATTLMFLSFLVPDGCVS